MSRASALRLRWFAFVALISSEEMDHFRTTAVRMGYQASWLAEPMAQAWEDRQRGAGGSIGGTQALSAEESVSFPS
mgnify:CR=1 FL=1